MSLRSGLQTRKAIQTQWIDREGIEENIWGIDRQRDGLDWHRRNRIDGLGRGRIDGLIREKSEEFRWASWVRRHEEADEGTWRKRRIEI